MTVVQRRTGWIIIIRGRQHSVPLVLLGILIVTVLFNGLAAAGWYWLWTSRPEWLSDFLLLASFLPFAVFAIGGFMMAAVVPPALMWEKGMRWTFSRAVVYVAIMPHVASCLIWLVAFMVAVLGTGGTS